jgi:hypothetical protein
VILFRYYRINLLFYLKLDRNILQQVKALKSKSFQDDCITAKKWKSLNDIMSLEEFAKVTP